MRLKNYIRLRITRHFINLSSNR